MRLVKILLLAFFFLSFNKFSFTQADKNFFEIRDEMNQYFSNKKIDFSEDTDWKHFKRWEAFMEPRVYPSGYFPNPSATWQAYSKEVERNKNSKNILSTGNWNYLGAGNYAGRVNCIIIDPNDTNTYWLGGATSGVWKTTNGGGLWTDMSNNMPVINVADIVINPTNSNEIYVATGDNFGWAYSNTFYGYTMGVLKSTNGGNTWNPTGFSWSLDQGLTFRRLIMNTNAPATLIAGTSKGIYRTTDGGTTWTKTKEGSVTDVEYHPTNKNIVYAVTDSIFKSVDGGLTWNHIVGSPIFNSTINYKYRRVSLAVTPKAPNNVYVLYSELNNPGLLYKSTNTGATFNALNCPTSSQVNNFLGYWTGVLEVSPTDTNRIIVGGTSNALTTDEGASWATATNNYVDQHAVTFLPNGVNYIGANDGGVYKKIPFTVSMNNGLQLIQFYRMGASATNANIIYGGRQDGGTLKYSGSVSPWSKVYSNDGTEAIVDYTSEDTVYASYQYGNYAKSVNGGVSFTPINPGMGYWMAPMVMHPTNHRILYYGGQEVRKSIDGGLTWNDISTALPTTYSMDISKSNPNYIYVASSYNTVNLTTNGGSTWTNVSSGLPSLSISYIAISATDPNTAWIVFSGFLAGQKVYKTANAGQSWTNISGTLPNIPVNCIEYDDNSTNDALYIGTDIGVYYRDNSLSDWVFYNTGLPPVIVNELEIHYGSNKIRAATYGRGMWESDLYTPNTAINEINTISTFSVYPNPSNGKYYVDFDLKETSQMELLVTNMLGEIILSKKVTTKFDRIELDLTHQPNGVYTITIISEKEVVTRKVVLNK
jgi:photosystem II stability/assembly factor-like uncharacterized protein